MTFKFYVQMDGQAYGPYTVRELMGLGLLDDTLITEESMNGEWLPAQRFDFDDMLRKEEGDNAPAATTQVSQSVNITSDHSGYSQMSHRSSTQQMQARIPSIVGQWNWGAFLLNWLWGIFNGVPLAFFLIFVNFIPIVGQIISIAVAFYLGMKGNELAWKGKTWSSIDGFEEAQRNWSIGAFWVYGVLIVLTLFGALAMGAFN